MGFGTECVDLVTLDAGVGAGEELLGEVLAVVDALADLVECLLRHLLLILRIMQVTIQQYNRISKRIRRITRRQHLTLLMIIIQDRNLIQHSQYLLRLTI